jgi:CubicO group peptidase (beta-lactamase class C family)
MASAIASASAWHSAMTRSRRRSALAAFIILSITALAAQQPAPGPYFPSRDNWERRKPSDVGMNDASVQAAVEWARTQASTWPKDFSNQLRVFGRQLAPMPAEHGDANAIVIRNGYIVAEFGDTTRIDPTYSVAKSYLASLLGLAIDRGLIKNITEPVGNTVHDGGYDSPRNAKITWEHHARQTSEWEGTLFGKVDTFTGNEEFGTQSRPARPLGEPGAVFDYNDVRINRLALSLMHVWKKALPELLKDEIMNPIGASDTWRYVGYDNVDVEIDGRKMKPVSGGSRWGGGIWMSTRDHARYGYLMLRQGRWNNRQILSASWVKQALVRGPGTVDYGYLWWLNTDGMTWPEVSKASFGAQGAGNNTIWIDPEHDLVIVWRWHAGNPSEFFKRIVASIRP